MERKTCIITGASSGIGKAAAIELVRKGHRVVLACRNRERAEATQREIGGETRVASLDLAKRASIHSFTDWAHRELGAIDVLINHAADRDLSRVERQTTPDGFETIWATNHLGPVLLVNRLLDRLTASPQGRIITTTSVGLLMHPLLTVDLKDPMFRARPYSLPKAYYQSQLAQLMFIRWLAGRLPGTMVTANCVRIGSMPRGGALSLWTKRIHAIRAYFAPSPMQMAETYVRAALDETLSRISGKHFTHPLKEIGIPTYAKDPLSIEQVMQLTYKQLGIHPAISFEPGGE